MKALHLISSGGLYGAESVLSNLVQGLQKSGLEVLVGVFHNARNPNLDIVEQLEKLSLPVEVIPCASRFDWRAIGIIRRIVKEQAVDVVHTHGYKADLYAVAATRSLKTSLIATCHNWPGRSLPLRAYAVLDRQVLRHFSHVVAVSKEVAERLESAGVTRKKISHISNGIDLERYRQKAPAPEIRTGTNGEVVVGFVGRLVPEKGCYVLLEAAAEVIAQFGAARFVLVGEGRWRSHLEDVVRKLGLQYNVCFLGRRVDMPNVYAAFDIFVLPSFAEGMPMAVLEAMASGKAVIATRVGSLGRIIEHGETGMLIEPNKVEELRDALCLLLSDHELREKLGRHAAARTQKLCSLESMTKAYLEVYRKVKANQAEYRDAATKVEKSLMPHGNHDKLP